MLVRATDQRIHSSQLKENDIYWQIQGLHNFIVLILENMSSNYEAKKIPLWTRWTILAGTPHLLWTRLDHWCSINQSINQSSVCLSIFVPADSPVFYFLRISGRRKSGGDLGGGLEARGGSGGWRRCWGWVGSTDFTVELCVGGPTDAKSSLHTASATALPLWFNVSSDVPFLFDNCHAQRKSCASETPGVWTSPNGKKNIDEEDLRGKKIFLGFFDF